MDAGQWTAILGGVASFLVPIGGGFAWLINKIVTQSERTVSELQKTLKQVQDERDEWRDRAYAAGWREDT